jgi:hypothetical protein
MVSTMLVPFLPSTKIIAQQNLISVCNERNSINYCLATAFGIRVQKIGNNYRVYKKVHTGSGWKSHFGGADLQFLELNGLTKGLTILIFQKRSNFGLTSVPNAMVEWYSDI